jgi:hypothetical protein
MRRKTEQVITYELMITEESRPIEFSDEQKRMLRPIAETLAMLDGNAFFTMDLGDGTEFYEQYLPEAWMLFTQNGGVDGWAGEASWVRDIKHETPAVRDAYENWRVLKALSKGEA